MQPVSEDTRKAAREHLRQLASDELARRRKTRDYRNQVRASIVKSLHGKQREVLDAVNHGETYISLCCSRRAGKTNLLSKLIVLALLDAGFNQAVFFAAPTKGIARDLIWKEVERLVDFYQLGWNTHAHEGVIETPKGAMFRLLGLDSAPEVEKPRGFDVVMFLTDETQTFEKLMGRLLDNVGPALTGRRGVFIAAGTPGYTLKGWWYDTCHGGNGFRNFHWTLMDNTKNPRPGAEVCAEIRAKRGWDESHPTFRREYLGEWVEDSNYMVFDFSQERNVIASLPAEYTLAWPHIIGIDYGFNDATAWTVLAVNPYTSERYVVYVEKRERLVGDEAAEITRNLVRSYKTTNVVCDPAGGGKPFFETFNARYGKELGCAIRAANKVDLHGSIHAMNTELRTGRLKLLAGVAEPLAYELATLRWKTTDHKEVLTSADSRDDLCDSARYALVESWAWATKPAPVEPSADEIERREREARQRAFAARARDQKKALWR